ncbi:UNVERIFIED_CONTAM: hypothetical protein GTU68_038112 [Idotea baltica]|nr:hypothetical protein [Idotea baltica]
MVDLGVQLSKIREEVDQQIAGVLDTCQFIKGPQVASFEQSLADFHKCSYAISCANGTDALQIALMALDLQPGDEVIVPAFTYVATAEVISLLHLVPVMVDVDPNDFNIDVSRLKEHISPKTKAIVPVHLYGQMSRMKEIMDIAREHDLYVIEDNAQGIGSANQPNGQMSGTVGHIGCTSFFPSKNLGCFGDGGALTTNDEELARKIRMIANHGQAKKYIHDITGVNSRLDAVQAAILNVKLKHLPSYIQNRQAAAAYYDNALGEMSQLQIPMRSSSSTHVFHQYTLKVNGEKRDALKAYLLEKGIPSMIYYPLPLYYQKAFAKYWQDEAKLDTTEDLCQRVLSLPMHTELGEEHLSYICDSIKLFFDS